ncbi:MAG TPA: GNAT family N-acetyltransferase [Chthoniobacterales bacterium]|nr:GNAT family N-acetyltransferase [Chthoniobacterales bacterium]
MQRGDMQRSGSSVPAPALAVSSPSPIHLNVETPFGSAVVVESVPAEDYNVWVAGLEDYPLDHRYYEIVHETLRDQFAHYYLLLKDDGAETRAIQPFLIVTQDLATGMPAVIRNVLARIRSRFPGFLKIRMLMVGSSAGEGDVVREKQSRDIQWTVDALRDCLTPVARGLKAMLIVFKDYPKFYREALDQLCQFGYTRLPSMPATKLALDFADFEDFLKTHISYSMRKNLRRKFRKTEGEQRTDFEVVTDITPYVDEVHPLYRQTLGRSELKFEELTKSYLCELGQRMSERARFFIWRQGGRIVAFASTIVHKGVLRDNYIGLDYSVALEYHLYFVTLRDTIIWALQNGIHTYHSAPLNYDPKYHFRMELEPLDLYVRAPSGLLNPIFKRVLPLLEPTRYDPVIRKFANAKELW